MQKTFLVMALIVPMAFAAPTFAPPAFAGADTKPESASPSEMISEATRTILKAVEMMMQSIPQYEVPEVLENGDIIIRRKHPEPKKPQPNEPPSKTRT